MKIESLERANELVADLKILDDKIRGFERELSGDGKIYIKSNFEYYQVPKEDRHEILLDIINKLNKEINSKKTEFDSL